MDGLKTYPIHGPVHSLDKCKVLGDFGYKYIKIIPTKERRHNTVTIKKVNRQQENSCIFNSAVD